MTIKHARIKYGSIDIVRNRKLDEDEYFNLYEVIELMKDYAVVMCNNRIYAFKKEDLIFEESMFNA